MATEIKIPSPGESISEVELATWFVQDGDYVEKDQEIGEIESEKATLPLIAGISGKVKLLKGEGETVEVGAVVGTIDGSEAAPEKKESDTKEKESSAPEVDQGSTTLKKSSPLKEEKAPAASADKKNVDSLQTSGIKTTPVAKQIMEKEGYSLDDILRGLKKIGSREVIQAIDFLQGTSGAGIQRLSPSREEKHEKMSNLRTKLSERLVAVKNETAMLTTFNEADMTAIMSLRKKYQDAFVKKYGIKLGFMSFFTKAVTIALQNFPKVNSRIEENEIVNPDFCDIGIAVQTDKGLMVPVLRNTEMMSLADIEINIMELAGKARKNRISIEDMSGGTFTITNGGIFGSMMSTPIINPPQSAILGMHTIKERPVALDGRVEIRPMMYLALSYDHRIIDGRDSVSFLVKVKDLLEDPQKMLFGKEDPVNLLLGLGS